MTTNATPARFRIEIEVAADASGARVLRALADVLTTTSAATVTAAPVPVPEAAAGHAWDLTKVRRDALGGESQVWRPMLRYLAERPDQWIYWREICDAVNRTPNQMAGALGAAERRCGKPPPYEKRHDGTDYQFRMPTLVAEVIEDVLGE